MATQVLDQDKAVDLIRKYRPQYENTRSGGGAYAIKVLCPFHNDNNPSFVFTPSTSRGFCFACKKNVSFEQTIAALEQTTTAAVEKLTMACYKKVVQTASTRKTKTIDIALAQLQKWHSDLETDIKLNILMKKWGWSKEVAEKYLIGSSEGRFSIPMFEGEDIVGLKFYTPGASTTKYQNAPGSAQCCWPLENLAEDLVYLVEGEKDCLTMLSAGFNAITFTSGAGAVPKEYIRYFAGKTIYIIYDIDEIGRKGAVTVANILACAAKKVHIVDLPLDGIPKGDLTDAYMADPENFHDFIQFLVDHTDEYQAPAAINRVVIPLEVHRTYLEDVVKNKLFYRRVRVKARVISNVHNETTVVPKDINLTCNRDFKDVLCQACPAYYKQEGLPLHIKPEYPEIMSMVGNNVKVQRAAIQSMTGVAEGCPKFKIEQKTHQALYPIVIIPAIEADKKHHNYSLVEAWALDVPAKENEDYDVEGVVMADPETQKLVLLCYRMTEDATSIDSFELTDDMKKQLEIFQCTAHPSSELAVS